MSDKPKFDYSVAHVVATQILEALEPFCERITIAGSLRRCENSVGDIEIVYVSKNGLYKSERSLFEEEMDLAQVKIVELLNSGILAFRPNVKGHNSFGPYNKLVRHKGSGIPVDLFKTDQHCWFNYLICRTGPAKFNIAVAQRARELGWKWHPCGPGFSQVLGEAPFRRMGSEEELFEFLGWGFLQPWERKLVVSEEKTGVEARPALSLRHEQTLKERPGRIPEISGYGGNLSNPSRL